MNFLSKLFKKKTRIKTIVKRNMLKVSGPNQNITFRLDENNNLAIKVEGDIALTVNGEFNILTSGNMAIDTLNSQLHFNSKMSSQIRDNDESIKYRNAMNEQLKKLKKEAIDTTKVLESVNEGEIITEKQKKIIDEVRTKQEYVISQLK